jgi:hypothetical protein
MKIEKEFARRVGKKEEKRHREDNSQKLCAQNVTFVTHPLSKRTKKSFFIKKAYEFFSIEEEAHKKVLVCVSE